MALNLTNAPVRIGATQTLIYAAPAGTTATIFDGTITNVDDANQAMRFVVFELRRVDGITFKLGNKIAIPYGMSPRVPKVVLRPGESLYGTADAANSIDCVIMIAERS